MQVSDPENRALTATKSAYEMVERLVGRAPRDRAFGKGWVEITKPQMKRRDNRGALAVRATEYCGRAVAETRERVGAGRRRRQAQHRLLAKHQHGRVLRRVVGLCEAGGGRGSVKHRGVL